MQIVLSTVHIISKSRCSFSIHSPFKVTELISGKFNEYPRSHFQDTVLHFVQKFMVSLNLVFEHLSLLNG